MVGVVVGKEPILFGWEDDDQMSPSGKVFSPTCLSDGA